MNNQSIVFECICLVDESASLLLAAISLKSFFSSLHSKRTYYLTLSLLLLDMSSSSHKPHAPLLVQSSSSIEFDQYGFSTKGKPSSSSSHPRKDLKRLNARVEKWRKMLPKMESLLVKRDKKLKERARKGIPDAIRLKVWPLLARLNETIEKYQSFPPFTELITSPTYPCEAVILADVPRTFPNHQLFSKTNVTGSLAL